MKYFLSAALFLLLNGWGTLPTSAGGLVFPFPFRNLDFEEYTDDDNLPGWNVNGNFGSAGLVGRNSFCFQDNCISLDVSPSSSPGTTIEGTASLRMEISSFDPIEPYRISQFGHIPENARFLTYKTSEFQRLQGTHDVPPFFRVFINNLPVPSVFLGESADHVFTHAVNVLPYVGQTHTKITFEYTDKSDGMLDSIAFSERAIPEPTSAVLTGIVLLHFGAFRNRR